MSCDAPLCPPHARRVAVCDHVVAHLHDGSVCDYPLVVVGSTVRHVDDVRAEQARLADAQPP